MFKKKEENKILVQLYYWYRKIQRVILAIAVMINIAFVGFVVNEGNLWVFLMFGLNLYVAGWAYFAFMSKHKKPKEKNPDVE